MNYCQTFINLSAEEETQEKFVKMLVPLIPKIQKLIFGQKFSLYILNINP
jgi:hypothetical protein